MDWCQSPIIGNGRRVSAKFPDRGLHKSSLGSCGNLSAGLVVFDRAATHRSRRAKRIVAPWSGVPMPKGTSWHSTSGEWCANGKAVVVGTTPGGEWCAKYLVGTPPGTPLLRTLKESRKNFVGIGHWFCYGDWRLGTKVLCTLLVSED